MSQNAHTPTSYTFSIVVHMTVVALFFLVGMAVEKKVREPVKVFEVVAGAGNNWQETEAPALGSPDGSESVKVPDIPAPKIADIKPAEPELPIPEAAPEPEPLKPLPAPTPKPKATTEKPSPLDTKKTTYADDIKRLSDRRYKKSMDKYRKQKEAEEKRAAAEAAKRMSKEEFDKKNAGKGGGSRITKVDAKGIAGGVVGGSTANNRGGAGGKALSVEEASLMDRYFAYLKQRLRASHVPPPGAGDQLSVEVEFHCAADGSLSRMRVSRSSGNGEFDQSVLEAFRAVKSVGARPDGKGETLVITFDAKEE